MEMACFIVNNSVGLISLKRRRAPHGVDLKAVCIYSDAALPPYYRYYFYSICSCGSDFSNTLGSWDTKCGLGIGLMDAMASDCTIWLPRVFIFMLQYLDAVGACSVQSGVR